ncbi:MAG: ABC transporter ATP-binding protein [Terriglobia bacterium]
MPVPSNQFKIHLENVRQRFRRIRAHARSVRGALIWLTQGAAIMEDFYALKGVSFTVRPGETLGIIGRNGSGKSTILKIIAAIFPPTAGTVEVNGRVSPLIELGAGFHPDLTGRENVILAGVLLGFTQRQMEERFDRIIAFAELEDFIDTPVRQYATGMFARLGFAVATEIDPDILLVDEVLAVGDESFQHKCVERINQFRRQGKTIVFVSHEMPLVRSICDRVLLLDEGRIVTEGPPDAVIARYRTLIEEVEGRTARRR